jgi:hypothetical protein
MIMRLTDLRSGWMGTRESVTCPCRQLDMFRRLVNRNQVHALASKFPPEAHDSFYSHTQRAFSKGNETESDGRSYAFTCRKIDTDGLEVRWSQVFVIAFCSSLVLC